MSQLSGIKASGERYRRDDDDAPMMKQPTQVWI